MTTRGIVFCTAALVGLGGLVGCTSASHGHPASATQGTGAGQGTSASSTAPSGPDSLNPTLPISGLPIPVSPSTSSAPSSPPATSTAPAPPPVADCTASQLSIDVAKGGASLGQEVAIVTFTNTSHAECALVGYPSAQLEDSKGKSVGTAATHAKGTLSAVLLSSGQAAQATLTAGTSCNAPLSSSVRIQAPDAPGATEVPVVLRACTLQITPVKSAD